MISIGAIFANLLFFLENNSCLLYYCNLFLFALKPNSIESQLSHFIGLARRIIKYTWSDFF